MVQSLAQAQVRYEAEENADMLHHMLRTMRPAPRNVDNSREPVDVCSRTKMGSTRPSYHQQTFVEISGISLTSLCHYETPSVNVTVSWPGLKHMFHVLNY